ncbi:hypothetical protein Gohar_002673 [Gossypium harknessii]|uniref:Uncharacterized protein n=1 Tax=Gossypium harknessii TaxID=34285 RepID=A0A7J9HLI5_9ROSI|nr:hypothetical protein [Gossypium harknessii]
MDVVFKPWVPRALESAVSVLRLIKWIWYRLSRNILPFSTMTLETCLGYIGSRTSISGDP